MTSMLSLISFTSRIRPALKRALTEKMIVSHADKHLTLVENDHRYSIYSFDRNQFPEIAKRVAAYREAKDVYDTLPSATLLSLVATFDSYFSEIVKFFLAIHPKRYTSSDRQMSLKEIFAKTSLEDVIDHVIDNEISSLMRGSHTEQVKFVESNLDIKIIDHYERWADFVEIFERRNLVAHGNFSAEPYLYREVSRSEV